MRTEIEQKPKTRNQRFINLIKTCLDKKVTKKSISASTYHERNYPLPDTRTTDYSQPNVKNLNNNMIRSWSPNASHRKSVVSIRDRIDTPH